MLQPDTLNNIAKKNCKESIYSTVFAAKTYFKTFPEKLKNCQINVAASSKK